MTEIGSYFDQLVVRGIEIYCVKIENHSVWLWDYGVPHSWTHIGDNCNLLMEQGGHILCQNLEDGSTSVW